MHEQLIFTAFLNKYFGGIAIALLHMVGLQPAHADAPITNPVAMEILVVLILLVFFVAVRASLSVDKPGGLQHLAEATEEFIADQAHGVMGHGYERYIPYAVVIGFFILLGNLLGLVPGFESPTANPTVPLGCALLTFIYYHFHGLRVHRHHYIKQFVGPVWALAPLMFQAARLLRDLGILSALQAADSGLTSEEVARQVDVTPYGVTVLLEAGRAAGLLRASDDRYFLTEVGDCLLADELASS